LLVADTAADAVPVRAGRLREQGVAATAAGHPATGARHLRRCLRMLGYPTAGADRSDLVARTLISLAHAEAEQGRVAAGLGLLDEAEMLLAPTDRGLLLQQRGLLLLRLGRRADALALLDAAIPLLAGTGPSIVLARTLLNRSALHLAGGHVGPARDDLRRCSAICDAEGFDLLGAKARHNIGYCDMLAGDLPAALRTFDEAGRRYHAHGPGFLPVLLIDKAKALLAAGLAEEAGRELDDVLRLSREQRLSQDHAEAELLRAQVALASGDLATAGTWAARASTHARRRGNDAWTALADLTRLRVRHRIGRAPGAVAGRAVLLAGRLRALGLDDDAAAADLLAIRALLRAGRLLAAQRAAAGLPPVRRSAPLETRLLHRLTRAELAVAGGERGPALRQARAGLGDLHRHRARLGSVDLQSGSAALGVELARLGLDGALDSGSPRLVFAWSERSRGQAFRVKPVRPPTDPATADAVAELRHLHRLIREAEIAGRPEPALRQRRPEPALRQRRADLERYVTERTWQAAGTGESSATATFEDVAAEAAAAGRTMMIFLERGKRLAALVIRDGLARLRDLGDATVAEEASRRLLGDLDALAGRRLPVRMHDVVLASVHRQRDTLTEHLLLPVADLLGDDDVVLVPTGWLSAVPWGVLPPLTGRPVTVAPSASVWLAGRRGARDRSPAGPPLLVAGPYLAHAPAEVHAIAAIDPASRVLTGEAATVEATVRGADGASVVHFAAHGHHEPENVLFSRLDLADGPLMAYDLQHLSAPPRHAVLSACDVGRTVVRAGDEILGFTAALLYAGTSSVVSSLVRVPDETVANVMIAYHRAVAGGAEPARALATASLAAPLVPFVCFGGG
jgi:tetratricopeptide (TPR) repeat protein